jgi:Phytanoyl-CoA dioxygenase (PhyH)
MRGNWQTGTVHAVDIRSRFEASGVVGLHGAFTAEHAAAMRDAIWRHAERQAGLRPADPASWAGSPVLNWQALSRDLVFRSLVDNESVRSALDAIFEAGGWRHPTPGAQILFSLPEPGPWVLPDGWHMDCGFDHATWPVPAVKLFAFVGEVAPYGGGTMVLSGTHRLVDRYRQTLPAPVGAGKANWRAFMRHHPWLARLLDGADRPDYGRALVGAAGEIDGVPVEAVELTGSPGDIVITHLHVFHARSPDTGIAPRLMLGKEIRRA